MKFDKKGAFIGGFVGAFTAAFSIVSDLGIVEKILVSVFIGAVLAIVVYSIWK